MAFRLTNLSPEMWKCGNEPTIYLACRGELKTTLTKKTPGDPSAKGPTGSRDETVPVFCKG